MAKHIVKLQQFQDGDTNPVIQELRKQLELNRVGHNELVEFCNENFKTFSEVTQHLDARVGALFIAFNDLVRGGIDNVTRETALITALEDPKLGPGVNWEAYIHYHLQRATAALEAYKAEQIAKGNLLTPEGAKAAEPGNEEQSMDVIFGGDQDVEASTRDQTSA